ncbi:MAG: 50S ribosomal protein L37e [Candidatus Altiarchaeota archaeon]|nr:50S ribosomal protein L37e [Candidatus Altiarchaeota archaeon]
MATEAPRQRKPRKTHGHGRCPRCGKSSYNNTKKYCSSCGYGKSKRRND